MPRQKTSPHSQVDILLKRMGSKSTPVAQRACERLVAALDAGGLSLADVLKGRSGVANYLVSREPDKARFFAKAATDGAEESSAEGPDAANAYRVSAVANWVADELLSLKHCRKALGLIEQARGAESAALANALNLLGLRLQSFDDNIGALEHYERARAIAEALGATHLRQQVLRRMSNAKQDMGQFSEAMDLLRLAEPAPGAAASERLSWQHSMALLHERRNQPGDAERRYDKCIRLFEKRGPDLSYQLAALTNAGQFKADMGRIVQAQYCLDLASSLKTTGQSDAYLASRERLRAKIAFQLGGVDAATEAIRSGLDLIGLGQAGNHARHSLILLGAEMLSFAGRRSEAVAWLQTRGDLSPVDERPLIDHEAHGAVLFTVLSFASDRAVPEWIVQQCLPVIGTTQEPQMEALLLAAVSELHASRGRAEEAVMFGKLAALGSIGSSWLRSDRAFQPATLKLVRGLIFDGLMCRLVDLGRLAEKRQIETAFNHQHIVDLSGDAFAEGSVAASIPMTAAEQAFASEYARSKEVLRTAARRLSAPRSPGESVEAIMHMLEQRAQDFVQLMLAAQPGLTKPPGQVSLAAVFRDAKSGQNGLLVRFNVGQSETVVEHRLHGVDGRIHLPVGARWLHREIDELIGAMSTGQGVTDVARRIHAAIMAPMEPLLRRADVINLIVDGPLWNLPFAALHDGNAFLVQSHVIRFHTGASSGRGSAWRTPRTVSAFGLGRGHSGLAELVHVRSELESIRHHFGSASINYDGKFSRARLAGALKRTPDIVHIATHFQAAPGASIEANLLIGGQEQIPASELAGAGFQWGGIPLVFLSACDTAAIGVDGGALASLLQALGVDWVVASLSPVRDQMTSELTAAFYAGLVEGLDPAQALQSAQISLLPNGSASADWASFRVFSPTL